MENIALTITLNGVQQTITSVEELEQAIINARDELQKFKGSQEEFRKISGEVSRLERTLSQVKTNKTQELLGSFARVGSMITSSFATAQAALNLFGVESENVTRAAAMAQNLLTFALGAREIATNLATLSTDRLTIATFAEGQATAATNVITRTFFNTLKANPIGLIVAAIGALVAIMFAYNDETEKASEQTEKLNRKLQDLQTTNQNNIRLLQAQGATEVEIAEARVKAADEFLRMSQFIYLNADKDAEDYYEKQKTYIQAQSDLEVAKAERDAAYDRADEKRKEDQIQRLDEIKKKAEEAEKARQEALLESIRLQAELTRELNQAIKTDFPKSEQIVALEKYNERLREYAAILRSPTTDDVNSFLLSEKLMKEMAGSLGAGQDILNELVLSFRSRLKESTAGFGEEIDAVTNDFLNRAGKLVQQGFITPEAFKAIQEYTNAYEVLAKKGIDIPLYITKSQQDNLAMLTKAVKVNTGEIQRDFDSTGKVVAATTKMSFSEASDELEKNYSSMLTQFTDFIIKNDDAVKKITDPQRQRAAAESLAQVRINIIRKQTDEIIKQEQRILEAIDYFNQLQAEKEATKNKAILGAVSKSIDGIVAQYRKLYDFQTQEAEVAFDEFIKGIVNMETLTETELEMLADLYRQFYEKINAYRKQDVDDEEKAQQKKIQNIKDAISELQAALTAIGQAVTDTFQFQLDTLEKRYKRITDNIVGDSKEANDKRLEADKAYNEEKLKLEKKAAKASLQIARAQALANTAVAITKAFEGGPIIGVIAAGLVAAASAYQVGLITAQINAVDSYRKGGFLKRQGGGFIVNGPAHEYGGVKYQGGTIELEGNEAVINRNSAIRYQDLLNQININGGGNALVNNFDDSRIVEAIAKQRMEPIRAYVVESDITNKQQVARRLELLSQI